MHSVIKHLYTRGMCHYFSHCYNAYITIGNINFSARHYFGAYINGPIIITEALHVPYNSINKIIIIAHHSLIDISIIIEIGMMI